MSVNLEDVGAGMRCRLDTVPDDDLRARLLRLGFLDGPVYCRHRMRNGPVVISRDGTDLAVGRSVAADIEVSEVAET
jgi:ferrous iron transport protein A